MFLKSAFFINF